MFRGDACGGHRCCGAGGIEQRAACADRPELCQTKVENFGVTALGDENVGGLDVAVNDAFGVRGVEPVGNLDGQLEDRFDFHRTAGDAMLQRHAVEKFHDDVGFAVFVADFVDGADIRMVQG